MKRGDAAVSRLEKLACIAEGMSKRLDLCLCLGSQRGNPAVRRVNDAATTGGRSGPQESETFSSVFPRSALPALSAAQKSTVTLNRTNRAASTVVGLNHDAPLVWGSKT